MELCPSPALIVLPVGLSILAPEFLWAKRCLCKARKLAASRSHPQLRFAASSFQRITMMAKTSQDLWQEAFQQIGATRTPSIEPLLDAYSEPGRFYHNWNHIEACLKAHQNAGGLTALHAIALFYHDCIYDTRRSDNEEQSADFMARDLRAVDVPEYQLCTLRRLILATRHNELPESRDEQLVVDADLSILGADPVDYRRYVEAIRQEYGWVDDASFTRGRGDFLKKLQARDHIYSTESFRLVFEDNAQNNTRDELESVSQQKS
ncbi:MAG: hypothetical protein RL693_389 [Verrucomicrobiota bacterium]|jgi:predicted metal-dependent HD superfamily phosphohydrolase